MRLKSVKPKFSRATGGGVEEGMGLLECYSLALNAHAELHVRETLFYVAH